MKKLMSKTGWTKEDWGEFFDNLLLVGIFVALGFGLFFG